MGMQGAQAGNAGVYNWHDVPLNQQVLIVKASFDQGGYQIYAQTGEVIVVPFDNGNLHVLKFGRSNTGQTYFVNDNNVAPILYLPPGGYVENAVAQGARWYPLPNDFAYSSPVYVAVAPTWADYMAMGWYPGMAIYGGMWGYRPGLAFAWMPGYYVNVGGVRYTSYTSYRTYYTSTPGYMRNAVVYRNYNTPIAGSSSSFGRSAFGSTRSGSFGNPGSSSGSFGMGRSSGFGNSGGGFRSGGFGNPGSSGGSFGAGRSGGFGSGGSFNSGPSGFSSGGRSSGGSFGAPRSSGSSSFGRSGGGSFGSRRR
jgi:hypothetical protein